MMQLMTLKCPTCMQNLTPRSNFSVVTSCANCSTAVFLHQSSIKALDIQYAVPASDKVNLWLPVWVYDGCVKMTIRAAQDDSKEVDGKAAQFWGSAQHPSNRQLYVPAWRIPITKVCEISSWLVTRQPVLKAIDPPVDAVVQETITTPEDGLEFLEFVVMDLEAKRNDQLRKLQFEIQTTKQTLWAFPARKDQSGWEFLMHI